MESTHASVQLWTWLQFLQHFSVSRNDISTKNGNDFINIIKVWLGIFGILGNYEVGARHRWQRDTIYNYLQLSTTIIASPEISGFPSHTDHSAVSAPRHDQLQISRHIANNTAIILDRKRSIGHQSQFVEIYTIYLFWWMKHFVEQCFWLIFSSIMDIWNVM